MSRIVADVRCVDSSEGLVLIPASDRHEVLRLLREAVPDLRLHSSAEGIVVPSRSTSALLDPPLRDAFRWSPKAEQYAQNRRWVRSEHARVLTAIREVKSGGKSVAMQLLPDVRESGVLDAHQWVNVACMTIPLSFGLCLFDEQGAGKTVSLIFAYDLLVQRDEVDSAIIVAPKSMIAEWKNDFHRFKGDLYKIVICTGSRTEKRRALGADADIIVTNFETVVSMERELTAVAGAHSGRTVLVVDESFFAKNLDAKRTRALRRLRESCRRAFVLCGTPAPNAPEDLVQQFNIVDFGITFDGVAIPDERDAAIAVVQDAIESRGAYVRHLKADVLPELTAKRFARVAMPLAPRQQALYDSASTRLVEDLHNVTDTEFVRDYQSFMARRSALLQICSHPVMVSPDYDEVPAKLRALDELLADLVGQRGEKVVLWSFYRRSLEVLANRYARFGPVRYDGSVVDVTERRESVRRFQEDDETMLFIGNPAAAGAGLTLHRARIAIYESMSNQTAHYLQSLDRIHRRGQQRDVEYLVLLCDGTIEHVEYDRLTSKEQAAQALLADDVPLTITREVMLAELLRMAPGGEIRRSSVVGAHQ